MREEGKRKSAGGSSAVTAGEGTSAAGRAPAAAAADCASFAGGMSAESEALCSPAADKLPSEERHPAVSVILPAYNARGYLQDAVSSVLRQQVPLELLIIDDGSTDGTGEEADRLAAVHPQIIRVFHTGADLGVAGARNIGIRAASGVYIAFLDADDWWADGKLARQLALLEESGCVLCGTGRELMHPDGTSAGRRIGMPARVSFQDLLYGNVLSCSSVVIRTQAAQEFEMCRDDLHEDYILWLRVLERYGDACGIDEALLKSRLSEGGKSRNKWKSARMTYGVYRYLGFSRLKSLWYFVHYAAGGLRKYYGCVHAIVF